MAGAAIAALHADQRTRIEQLGRRRLERAAAPLVGGWAPADLASRIGAERVDRAENLAAVLAAILRRYALEPSPRELRAAHHAAEQARRSQPPPAAVRARGPVRLRGLPVLPPRRSRPRRPALPPVLPIGAAQGGGRMTAAWMDNPVPPQAHPAPGGWAEQAACRHEDPDLFFPPEEEHGRYAVLRETLAKRICLGCPVLGECTAHALAHDERYGV